MATLLQRLSHDVDQDSSDPQEQTIAGDYFYSALVGVSLGQFTRAEIEAKWDIGTSGTDKAQMDIIFNGYANAADKGRYKEAVHALFMLIESGENLSGSAITDWLTAAESAYPIV